jgi:hypothetical protein
MSIGEFQKMEQIQDFSGALRGVPADGGVSETLWARTRGKAFPLQKFCIIFKQTVPALLA